LKIEKTTAHPFAIKPHKTKKRKVHWHLLMIGENGKILNLQQYKIFAILIIIVICISTASAFYLFYLFQNTYRETKILKESIYEFETIISSLKKEKDVLAARLIITGNNADLEKKKDLDKQVDIEPAAELEKIPGIDETENAQELAEPNKDVIEEINEEKDNSAEEFFLKKDSSNPDIVVITDFTARYKSENKTLDLNFKLSNLSKQPVSGYIFLILKNHQIPFDKWVTLPENFLDSNGLPSNYQAGINFEISRFKFLPLKAQHIENLGKSFKADVFVFDKNGDLLFNQEFPVEI
jgi:hypothetical protein